MQAIAERFQLIDNLTCTFRHLVKSKVFGRGLLKVFLRALSLLFQPRLSPASFFLLPLFSLLFYTTESLEQARELPLRELFSEDVLL